MDYEREKYLLQVELRKWQRYASEQDAKNIIIFEGRDGAGKSSTIKTITEHLNPRTARVVALPKPTEEERQQWYWQRYINQFPRRGEVCFFDRSWYNRCLIERVFLWATQQQVMEFYSECPQLEKMWTRAGYQITKFYLSVSREEQSRRFMERQFDPLKLGKLTDVDILGQARWDDYTRAKRQMMALTNIKAAPWIEIKSDDKHKARLNVMRYILLNQDYKDRDIEAIGHIDTAVVKPCN